MGWPNNYVQGFYDETGNVVGISGSNGSGVYLGNKDISTKRIKVGMNYFPGWAPVDNRWVGIPADRMPLQGQYDETLQSVIDKQIQQMRDYGIDFVYIDWYLDTTTHDHTSSTLVPSGEHWVNGFMSSTVPGKPKFCINFANGDNASRLSNANFASCITYFINNYFSNSNYLKIDGKPVLMFVTADATNANLTGGTALGSNTICFPLAKTMTIAAGYPDLFITAGMSNSSNYWKAQMLSQQVDAIYILNSNKRYDPVGDNVDPKKNRTFSDIIYSAYGAINGLYKSWTDDWVGSSAVTTGHIKLWCPISSGFDNTPWTPTTILKGMPTESEFAKHLADVRTFAESNYTYTNGFVTIQSWNEYGEGGVCEPTVSHGFRKLELIKDILSC